MLLLDPLRRVLSSARDYVLDYVPFVPSRFSMVDAMLELAEIERFRDVVYDIGCGDGRIVIRSVEEPFCARLAVGIEKRRSTAELARERVKALGLERRVRILNRDVFDCSLEEADVVTLYLGKRLNERLRPKMERELKDTARVVCNTYKIRSWRPSRVVKVNPGPADLSESIIQPMLHNTVHIYKMCEVNCKGVEAVAYPSHVSGTDLRAIPV